MASETLRRRLGLIGLGKLSVAKARPTLDTARALGVDSFATLEGLTRGRQSSGRASFPSAWDGVRGWMQA